VFGKRHRAPSVILLWLTYRIGVVQQCCQRRIFIFGAVGYFKLGALLEGSRQLMSYKLALHVLGTFTDKVVPIYDHISLLYSERPRYQEQKQS